MPPSDMIKSLSSIQYSKAKYARVSWQKSSKLDSKPIKQMRQDNRSKLHLKIQCGLSTKVWKFQFLCQVNGCGNLKDNAPS